MFRPLVWLDRRSAAKCEDGVVGGGQQRLARGTTSTHGWGSSACRAAIQPQCTPWRRARPLSTCPRALRSSSSRPWLPAARGSWQQPAQPGPVVAWVPRRRRRGSQGRFDLPSWPPRAVLPPLPRPDRPPAHALCPLLTGVLPAGAAGCCSGHHWPRPVAVGTHLHPLSSGRAWHVMRRRLGCPVGPVRTRVTIAALPPPHLPTHLPTPHPTPRGQIDASGCVPQRSLFGKRLKSTVLNAPESTHTRWLGCSMSRSCAHALLYSPKK